MEKMTYRKIDTAIWSDSEVIELSQTSKFAYMYLLTAPQGALSGCFECSAACLARDTGMSVQDAASAIEELVQRNLVAHDPKTKEVLISNWGAHQWSRSQTLVKALEKSISKIKSHELKSRAKEAFEDFTGIPYAYGSDTVYEKNSGIESAGQIPYAYDSDTVSDTDTESDSSSIENPILSANPKKPEEPRGGFRRKAATPSLAEIEDYARWRGLNVDCAAFFDFNEQNGWMIDGERIKHWRRAFDRWAEKQNRAMPARTSRKPPGHGNSRKVIIPSIEPCPECGGNSWYVAGSTYQCPRCGTFDVASDKEAIAS